MYCETVQRWFIITSVQGYGHVARNPKIPVHDHQRAKS